MRFAAALRRFVGGFLTLLPQSSAWVRLGALNGGFRVTPVQPLLQKLELPNAFRERIGGLASQCRNVRPSPHKMTRMTPLDSQGSTRKAKSGLETVVDHAVSLLFGLEAKRYATWAVFIAIAYQLKTFYPVILGTFILSYVGRNAVHWMMLHGNFLLKRSNLPIKKLPRSLYAFMYIVLLLSAIIATSVLTVPIINVEFQFLSQLGDRENPYMLIADWIRSSFGPDALQRLEPFLLTVAGEGGRSFAGYEVPAQEVIARQLTNKIPWDLERNSKFAKLLQFCLGGYLRRLLGFTRQVVSQLTKILYSATLSLFFSIMIIWDLPKLSQSVKGLRNTHLRFGYETIGPQISKFSQLLGQSFEVQFAIACANTVLTTFGMVLLGIRGAWVLSTIVFLCSFIPVAGIFLSTIPIALSALCDFGVSKVIEVAVMVLGVHAAEACLLNPYLYASKLKLHPVVILTVLYITEHVMGITGLILGVPVAVYFLNIALGMPPSSFTEKLKPTAQEASSNSSTICPE